jgi:predicted dehydrogenase
LREEIGEGRQKPGGVPIRIGVVGCGRAALQLHLPALARIPGVSVTALADVDPAGLRAAGEKWGVAQRYTDYGSLVVDPSVDVVLISAPTSLHHEVFLAAAEAGKHIYIEKPLALTLEEADRMRSAAARSAGRTAVGFNLRSHRLIEEARKRVREGALGSIRFMRTALVGNVRARPSWACRRAAGGGAIYELGIHHFDLWRFLLGAEVAEVTAQSGSDGGDDANVVVTARMCNGVLACSALALQGAASHDIEIVGESSSLRFSLYRADSMEMRPVGRLQGLARWLEQFPGAMKAARHGGDFLDSYRIHWLRFLSSIRSGEPPASLEDGRESLRIALAAIESLNQRRAA